MFFFSNARHISIKRHIMLSIITTYYTLYIYKSVNTFVLIELSEYRHYLHAFNLICNINGYLLPNARHILRNDSLLCIGTYIFRIGYNRLTALTEFNVYINSDSVLEICGIGWLTGGLRVGGVL